MTSFVGLDPSAASDLAAHLDEAAADLEAHACTVAGLLAQAGISSSTASAELQDVASWARYRSRDLRRRISEITAAAGGGPGIRLQGFLFANRAEAAKAGRDEAKNVGGLLRSHDKKKLDAALSDLKRYGDDPSYAAAFFKRLGPTRTYALLMATAGRDSAAVVGGALVLARRTGGITVHFIDGIIVAARKAAAAVQAYTGAIPKELRVQYAQDEYVRRAGSQHPDLVKYLEAIEPLTPYLESGAKVAVIGGAVVIVTGVAACVFLSDGACLGPAVEILAGTGPVDADALQELESKFGAVATDVVEADGGLGVATVDDALSSLAPGRSPGVRVVPTVDDLFARLSEGGTTLDSSYPGKLVRLSDGTTVGLRQESESGGPTIDIAPSDGERIKVHVDPWPPTK